MLYFKLLVILIGISLFVYEGLGISGDEFKSHFDSYDRLMTGHGNVEDFIHTFVTFGYVGGISEILNNPFEDAMCIPFYRWSGANMPLINDFIHTDDNKQFVSTSSPYNIIVAGLSKEFPCSN